MKRILPILLLAALISGCAGLRTRWVLQMVYETPTEEVR